MWGGPYLFGEASPYLAIQTLQMIGNVLVTNANARRPNDSLSLSDEPTEDMLPYPKPAITIRNASTDRPVRHRT